MGTYRAIANQQRWRKLAGSTDAAVLKLLNVISPRHLLQLSRLRLLVRLIGKANILVWTILLAAADSPRSWLRAIKADLAECANASSKLSALRGKPLADWMPLLRDYPKQSKALFAAICLQLSTTAVCEAAATPDSPSAAIIADRFPCRHCDKVKKSYQARAVHEAKQHRVLRPLRKYITGTVCPTCLTQFGSRSKAIDHVAEKSKAVCLVNTILRVPPISDDAASALDDLYRPLEAANRKRGQRYNQCDVKAKQCEGPLHQLYVPRGHSRESPKFLFAMYLASAIEVDFNNLDELLAERTTLADDLDVIDVSDDEDSDDDRIGASSHTVGPQAVGPSE